ncbi:MAG: translation initiation factor IF-3 [Chloroflexi bacterium]|nr:translation initiation factor IF-3 [Chloroflexota bacterium]
MNYRIRAREIRLIGDEGEQIGLLPTDKALQMAGEKGLDLVEVAPTATPPVCRILDYGKYRYEQTKKEKKVRSGQRSGLLKEIRVRPQVKDHDLDIKINRAKKFVIDGDKVKVLVVFRGRQMVHPELGIKLLQKVANDLKGVAQLDGQPIHEGRIMSLILSPISAKQVVAKDGKDSKEIKETKETKETKEIKVKETV